MKAERGATHPLPSSSFQTPKQLAAALRFLEIRGNAPLDAAALDAAAGVGVVVPPEALSAAVDAAIGAHKPRILEARYRFPIASLLKAVADAQPWADGGAAKAALDAAVAALLGPRTAADDVKPTPVSKKKEAAPPAAAAAEAPPPPPADPYAFFPDPAANNRVHTEVPMSDGSTLRPANTAAELGAHLARTGGGVVTRFPPEPNGYLHLGHAKACFIDFGLAKARGGKCYLRFDDTNPTAEKVEFIDHIKDIVSWLGWRPAAVTYSSDHFPRLIALAVDLVKRGHAYVCHQTPAEVKAARDARAGSPWRDRPAGESLALFDDMTRGLVEEGKATLRLKVGGSGIGTRGGGRAARAATNPPPPPPPPPPPKMDPQNDNYNMFDLVAYRVKFAPHPHAGRGWCVYPSYDYTHCLVDSFEDVTHSLCTLEFEPRRASYYWLLQVAGLYKPVVWEYSRLSVTHNVLSKRKLAALVSSGAVSGWDDPRLLTLAGLRRRGMTADAINAFCRECGITRAGDGEVSHRALDAAARADADARSPRALAVLAPLEVELTNLNADHLKTYRGRVWPNKPVEDNNETYELPLTRTVYIEATDYRVEDAKGYYGLAPGKSVMLRYAGVATAASHDVDPATGAVVKVYATFAELAGGKPPKGVLSWVGQPSPGVAPFAFEARLYGPLFKSPSPGALGDAWMADVDPASEAVASGAVGSAPLATAPVGSRFQLERLGYFIVDAPGALIRTVTLRETVATKGVRAAGGGA